MKDLGVAQDVVEVLDRRVRYAVVRVEGVLAAVAAIALAEAAEGRVGTGRMRAAPRLRAPASSSRLSAAPQSTKTPLRDHDHRSLRQRDIGNAVLPRAVHVVTDHCNNNSSQTRA